MRSPLIALFLLLAPAAQAQGIAAFPTPGDLSHNMTYVQDMADLTHEAFSAKVVPGLAYTVDVQNPRRATPGPEAVAEAAAQLRQDETFADLLLDYHGLIGAYALLLPEYGPAFEAFRTAPTVENTRRWRGIAASCNLVYKALKAKGEALQARAQALRS